MASFKVEGNKSIFFINFGVLMYISQLCSILICPPYQQILYKIWSFRGNWMQWSPVRQSAMWECWLKFHVSETVSAAIIKELMSHVADVRRYYWRPLLCVPCMMCTKWTQTGLSCMCLSTCLNFVFAEQILMIFGMDVMPLEDSPLS